METQQIRHFVAAVEHGNLTRAADSLGISQPALTRSIHNLESMLGVKLLERGPFGVRPTPFGEMFVDHAQLILNETKQAISGIDALKSGAIGQVAIGATPDCAGDLLPRAIGLVHRRMPELKVRVREGWMEELIPRLRVADLDLIVGPNHTGDVEAGLHCTPIGVHRFPTVVRREHPFAPDEVTTLKQLATAKWILPDQNQARAAFMVSFQRHGVTPPAPVVSATSFACTIRMLQDDDYVTMLPETLISTHLESKALRPVHRETPVPKIAIAIYRRARGLMLPPTKCLVESLKAVAGAGR